MNKCYKIHWSSLLQTIVDTINIWNIFGAETILCVYFHDIFIFCLQLIFNLLYKSNPTTAWRMSSMPEPSFEHKIAEAQEEFDELSLVNDNTPMYIYGFDWLSKFDWFLG